MKHLLTIILLALTCATLHAQSVVLQGSGPSSVQGVGAGSVKGYVIPATYTNYSAGRFTIWNTNQAVVVDTDSGLMWPRNASPLGHGTNWYASTNWVAELTYAGHSDWRLPNRNEFSRYGAPDGLFGELADPSPALPAGHPFTNIFASYWTSVPQDVDYVHVQYWDGFWGGVAEYLSNYEQIWPVRGP